MGNINSMENQKDKTEKNTSHNYPAPQQGEENQAPYTQGKLKNTINPNNNCTLVNLTAGEIHSSYKL